MKINLEKTVITVQKEIPVIKLELTEEEASVLVSITGQIGGCPGSSPRKFTDRLRAGLISKGIPIFEQHDKLFLSANSSIYFNTTEKGEKFAQNLED